MNRGEAHNPKARSCRHASAASSLLNQGSDLSADVCRALGRVSAPRTTNRWQQLLRRKNPARAKERLKGQAWSTRILSSNDGLAKRRARQGHG